jgi:hypothetical protein
MFQYEIHNTTHSVTSPQALTPMVDAQPNLINNAMLHVLRVPSFPWQKTMYIMGSGVSIVVLRHRRHVSTYVATFLQKWILVTLTKKKEHLFRPFSIVGYISKGGIVAIIEKW